MSKKEVEKSPQKENGGKVPPENKATYEEFYSQKWLHDTPDGDDSTQNLLRSKGPCADTVILNYDTFDQHFPLSDHLHSSSRAPSYEY